MIILAKITTFFILTLAVAYGLIFYSPAFNNTAKIPNNTVTPTNAIESTETPAPTREITTNTPVPTKTPQITTPTPTKDARCIIRVDGVSYDVSEYRNIHSGGDIFKCGADMTEIFYDRHSAKLLQKMSQYKI